MTKRFRLGLMATAIMSLLCGNALAGGFQLQNQTGSGNGNAFAGAAAAAEDAGTVFFNPAGMTYLSEGHSFSLAGTIQNRSIKFQDTGTTGTLPSTSNGKDAGSTALIPAFYWAYALDSSTRIGLGVSPTFGNETDYGFDFIGRNSAYYANIKQYNVNPSVAYKVDESLSVGFGINYATNESEFKNGVYGVTNSIATTKGKDDAFGFNAGLIFKPDADTRVALTYRSELRFKLDGTQTFSPQFTSNKNITAKLTTPAQASLAMARKISDTTELLADLTWTGWSVVKSLDIVDKSTGSVTSISYNFRNTMRFGLGANYQYSDSVKLRFGTAYDQGVVKAPADRTMTLPDSDRIWLAFGARYTIDRNSSVDIGYSHVFFADATTARVVNGAQTVKGKWTGNRVDMIAAQWNYNFK